MSIDEGGSIPRLEPNSMTLLGLTPLPRLKESDLALVGGAPETAYDQEMVTPRARELARRPRPRALDFDQRLKLHTTWLRRFYVFVWVEARRRHFRLPLRTRLKAWRHGFMASSWAFYDLDHNDLDLYLPDFRFRNYALFEPHRLAIMEKLTFTYLMRALGVPHPQPLAFVHEGKMLRLGTAHGAEERTMDLRQLFELADGLVFRHVGGWASRGVFFVRRSGGSLTMEGRSCSIEAVEQRIAGLDQYLITEYLENADYAERITPQRPAELRLLTLWDIDRNEPFIAAATHKFRGPGGVLAQTFGIGRGGYLGEIDLETGTLGPGLNIDLTGQQIVDSRHPESGAQIEGVVVPEWKETCDMLLRAAARLPEFPLIGWDILMTNDGPRWLEGNSPSGVDMWQAHTPLLRDPRSRAFFEWLGCI